MTYTVDYESPAAPPRHGGKAKIAAAVAVIAVVLGLGYFLGRSGSHKAATPVKPAPAGVASKPDHTSGASGAGTAATGGLRRGVPRAGEGGSRAIFGVRVGYQQSSTDAVQAATNYVVGQSSPAAYVHASAADLNGYIFTPEAQHLADTDEAANQQALQINAAGQVVDPATGALNPQLKLYANCYPVYGAYNVVTSSTTTVALRLWMPCAAGPGSDDDTSKVRIAWVLTDVTVKWASGDWRIVAQDVNIGAQPSDVRSWKDLSLSYVDRARLLREPSMLTPPGHGWTLYGNATDAPLPYLGGQPS